MNEEQEKFWNILSEPYVKGCFNCKFSVATKIPMSGCNDSKLATGKHSMCVGSNKNTFNNLRNTFDWKWDRENNA